MNGFKIDADHACKHLSAIFRQFSSIRVYLLNFHKNSFFPSLLFAAKSISGKFGQFQQLNINVNVNQ
jgi:hypothetical protein